MALRKTDKPGTFYDTETDLEYTIYNLSPIVRAVEVTGTVRLERPEHAEWIVAAVVVRPITGGMGYLTIRCGKHVVMEGDVGALARAHARWTVADQLLGISQAGQALRDASMGIMEYARGAADRLTLKHDINQLSDSLERGAAAWRGLVQTVMGSKIDQYLGPDHPALELSLSGDVGTVYVDLFLIERRPME